MGEGIGNDAAIIPYITSANIACGYHAGDEKTMYNTVMLAKKFGVAIGAHPSFADRENFGRTEMKGVSTQQVYDLVTKQLRILQKIVLQCDAQLHHLKPHGALYNMAARDASLAAAIARALNDFDVHLVLIGLSGSQLITQAKAMGIKTASEVFADRTYQEDGSLTPRNQNNALIHDEEQSLKQVLRMLKSGKVTTVSGTEISIIAETICIHGDGKNAVAFAKSIHDQLKAEGIEMKAV
ncbi:UPF0271 protein [Segetibacter aerophilus]|uniref:UPF0271 protein n=2 Tax=Segetibacter aerophilus TaxID=670293 RepID=A0A512BI08_9BACT|nr:UPF0271 protein [Segetibacter aerophilus]